MTERSSLYIWLVLMGAGWGATIPLSKIAVSEGYRHLGLIFWQLAIGAIAMALLRLFLRRASDREGSRPAPLHRIGLRTDRPALFIYFAIAMIGTLLPNSASYEALRHLPAGLISIFLSLVPIMAYPVALALRNERFAVTRLGGLLLGLIGVLFIVGPEASLPERALIVFIPLALIAPMLYAFEGNFVASWGTAGLDPIDVLYGASITGAIIAFPAALATGTFISPLPPYGAPDLALILSALIHVVVYTGYVWMVGRAGPVFAIQVSYLVTIFGVFWSLAILGERYSVWVWGAMVVILSGVFLVQPRLTETLDETQESGNTPQQ